MIKSEYSSHTIIFHFLIVYSIFNGAIDGLQTSDFYVNDLPLLPKNSSSIRMHAGYLPVNHQHHGALFFWHFADKSTTDKSTTVIWLAGGPGGSSIAEAWWEIGPFRFQQDGTIVKNNGSWSLFANLLFVDQPVGTGFSYIDTDSFIHDLPEMADQFLYFLDRYIEIFPELLDEDIYLAGSSFAGQYIPYIAQAILEKRMALKLHGLLIGNGWIDPRTTYMSYLPFAVEKNLVEKESAFYNRMSEKVKECQEALSKKVHVLEDECELILQQITLDSPQTDYYAKHYKYKCMDMYNLHLANTDMNCGINKRSEEKYVTTYLQRQDVMSRIHVDEKKVNWTDFSYSVHRSFDARHSTPSVEFPSCSIVVNMTSFTIIE